MKHEEEIIKILDEKIADVEGTRKVTTGVPAGMAVASVLALAGNELLRYFTGHAMPHSVATFIAATAGTGTGLAMMAEAATIPQLRSLKETKKEVQQKATWERGYKLLKQQSERVQGNLYAVLDHYCENTQPYGM